MKTILILSLLFSCYTLQAQFESEEYNEKPKKEKQNFEPPKETEQINWIIKNKCDSISYELYHMRYYVGQFREQSGRGRRLMFTGAGLSLASVALISNTSNFYYIGAGLGGTVFVIGGLIRWSSNKWLRNAILKPTSYGVSLEVAF